jgi:ribosomal protein S1
VHISQLARDRVEHPEDVVSVGQEVFVKVLTVDPPDNARGRPKIALSMKYADQVR